jgi:hypothetical protein
MNMSLYNTKKRGVSEHSWYRRMKRRELVLEAGSQWPYRAPIDARELAHLASRGVRVPRSMRPRVRRPRGYVLEALARGCWSAGNLDTSTAATNYRLGHTVWATITAAEQALAEHIAVGWLPSSIRIGVV